jgi:hypothetical protein
MGKSDDADDAAAILGDQGVFAFVPIAKVDLEGELLG